MREEGVHEIEVHVAAMCIAKDTGRVLALKRGPARGIFPFVWEGGVGGQVHAGETLEAAVLRHLAQEAGLAGRVLFPYATYAIPPGPHNPLIPGIRFLVEVEKEQPIRISAQHTEVAWLSPAELLNKEWIPGLLAHLQEGLRLYAERLKAYS